MRRILIDRARRRKTVKHGGDRERIPLADAEPEANPFINDENSERLLLLDQAIESLTKYDQRKAELVKLRYFAGLTYREACLALDISPATGDRDWVFSKAWLQRAMEQLSC